MNYDLFNHYFQQYYTYYRQLAIATVPDPISLLGLLEEDDAQDEAFFQFVEEMAYNDFVRINNPGDLYLDEMDDMMDWIEENDRYHAIENDENAELIEPEGYYNYHEDLYA